MHSRQGPVAHPQKRGLVRVEWRAGATAGHLLPGTFVEGSLTTFVKCFGVDMRAESPSLKQLSCVCRYAKKASDFHRPIRRMVWAGAPARWRAIAPPDLSEWLLMFFSCMPCFSSCMLVAASRIACVLFVAWTFLGSPFGVQYVNIGVC